MRPLLCNTSFPLPDRVSLLHQTVGATLLFGSGLLRLGAMLQARLIGIEFQQLRALSGVCKLRDETWISYHRRRRSAAVRARESTSERRLWHPALRSVQAWHGHVARTTNSLGYAATSWRDTTWWRTARAIGDPTSGEWRHPTRNWRRLAEYDVTEFYGPRCHSIARERDALSERAAGQPRQIV